MDAARVRDLVLKAFDGLASSGEAFAEGAPRVSPQVVTRAKELERVRRLCANPERQRVVPLDLFPAEIIETEDVVLFMKGTPQFPQCGFSGQVVQILDYLGVPYTGVNVLESDELRQGIKAYTNWPTIPQLYVKGELVGGCDIVTEMYETGELHETLGAEKPAETAEAPAPEAGGPPPLGIENRLG